MPPRPELQAAALGVVQGFAELLPVSSSAHVAAVPWLLGWEALEPARQKELEVALHAGALLALAPALIRALPDPRTLALSLVPPVMLGYVFERPIEERLGGPVALAGGLLVGAAALALADRVERDTPPRRPGLALGLAQAAALAPGRVADRRDARRRAGARATRGRRLRGCRSGSPGRCWPGRRR